MSETTALLLDNWGSWLAFLLTLNMCTTVLIFIYEHYYLPKPATWQDVHRIVFDAKYDLMEQIKNIDDPNRIKEIILESELRTRDRIKALKDGNKFR